MRRKAIVIFFVLIGCSTIAASAAEIGTIVVTTRGCSSRYVAETSLGFVLLEWYGGYDPSRGDEIIGELHSYGMKDVLISGNSSQAWVDDYMLSKSRVIEKLTAKNCSW